MDKSDAMIEKNAPQNAVHSSGKTEAPIAVFDSGVGGISVLRELLKIMPEEDFFYYGDSKNAPYGTRTTEEVRTLTLHHVRYFLEEKHVKGVVIACNTATSAAVRCLREIYPDLPLVGIEPALKPAVTAYPTGRIVVMATPMTIREEKFHRLLDRFRGHSQILPLACPGLMEYVEEGRFSDPSLTPFLTDLLSEALAHHPDAAVLGCTHYPFVKKQISSVLGDDVEIFDGGGGTAREMKRRLSEAGLLRKPSGRRGRVVFENSADDPAKTELCRRLLSADESPQMKKRKCHAEYTKQ